MIIHNLTLMPPLGVDSLHYRSAAVKYGDSQLAIFHVPRRGYYATQQMCPHKRAFVLEHGIIGDDPKSGGIYVSCESFAVATCGKPCYMHVALRPNA